MGKHFWPRVVPISVIPPHIFRLLLNCNFASQLDKGAWNIQPTVLYWEAITPYLIAWFSESLIEVH